MNIVLGYGIDNIVFGLREPNLVKLLGPANKRTVTESGNIDLQYYQSKLILKIEPENEERLGWIVVRNRQSRMLGINPWLMERTELLALLATALNQGYEFSDYDSMESYFFDNRWLELQYELGDLTSISFGVPYTDNDEPLWPAS